MRSRKAGREAEKQRSRKERSKAGKNRKAKKQGNRNPRTTPKTEKQKNKKIAIQLIYIYIPSGKRLHNYEKSQLLMGKSTISRAIFNSFLFVYQRVTQDLPFVLPRFFWCPARWFSKVFLPLNIPQLCNFRADPTTFPTSQPRNGARQALPR